MTPTRDDIAEVILRVLLRQAKALELAASQTNETLSAVVESLLQCKGRVIMTGIGKMGAVARKAASTFSSTGTPSIFVHPTEAMHGDLGMITQSDLLIALSYSGETEEVLKVVETIQPWQVPIVAMTNSSSNSLARLADSVIEIRVESEGTDMVAVPSCSTTVAMAICDSLAIAAMENRGFTAEDFSIFHPGGTLGRNLRTKVSDLMKFGDQLPTVEQNQTLREAIVEISSKGVGATLVVDDAKKLVGILTDGDVRRILQTHENPLEMAVTGLMTKSPKACLPDVLAAKALRTMEEFRITVLPVTCDSGRIAGIVHLHDIVSARIG